MRSNARVWFAFVGILLVGLLAGCGNKTPTIQIISPQSGAVLANNTVHFTTMAEDPDSDPLTYKWFFGDGSTSAVQSVSHTYAVGGDYTVNLAVSDRKHTVQTAIEIHINIRPSSKISWKVGEDGEWNAGAIEGTAPLHLEFDRSTSCDVDGRIVSYDWVFHDGTTASGPSSEYSYAAPGRYSVKLGVVDDLGASAECSIDVVLHTSLTQSLETVRSLELLLSPLRSDVLTTMFPFSNELLHVQGGQVLYMSHITSGFPKFTSYLSFAINDKLCDCDSTYSFEAIPLRSECEAIQSSISPAFAAALACEEARCSAADCARLVLGFEELVALTEQAAAVSQYVHVATESNGGGGLTLDTTKLPGALLQLPTSFFSELASLNKEFDRLASIEQERINWLIKQAWINGVAGQERIDWVTVVDSFPSAWDEAEYVTTEQLWSIDAILSNWVDSLAARPDTLNTEYEESLRQIASDSLAARLDTLNTEYEESLRQIASHVRDQARSQFDQALQQGTYRDRAKFGIVVDNSYGNRKQGQLALVYYLDSPDRESRPIEFAIFQRGDVWVVRVVPHTQIKARDVQYLHPDLQFFYKRHGLPSTVQIEPYYEIQYEQYAFGWYITPTWDPQYTQAGACFTALFSVRDGSFSQTEGNCTISLSPSSTNRTQFITEVCFETLFEIVSSPLEDSFFPFDGGIVEGTSHIRGTSRNIDYSYRVIYPGSYP